MLCVCVCGCVCACVCVVVVVVVTPYGVPVGLHPMCKISSHCHQVKV